MPDMKQEKVSNWHGPSYVLIDVVILGPGYLATVLQKHIHAWLCWHTGILVPKSPEVVFDHKYGFEADLRLLVLACTEC